MQNEFKYIVDVLSETLQLQVSDILTEKEAQEYDGCNFKLGDSKIKYRKAKVTPKKAGQFVTLWKRTNDGKTAPFHVNDDFDFYIIAINSECNFGFFIFPKDILGENQILTNKIKEGKRGFRVYTVWDAAQSQQAKKTKSWQTLYFVDLISDKGLPANKIREIII